MGDWDGIGFTRAGLAVLDGRRRSWVGLLSPALAPRRECATPHRARCDSPAARVWPPDDAGPQPADARLPGPRGSGLLFALLHPSILYAPVGGGGGDGLSRAPVAPGPLGQAEGANARPPKPAGLVTSTAFVGAPAMASFTHRISQSRRAHATAPSWWPRRPGRGGGEPVLGPAVPCASGLFPCYAMLCCCCCRCRSSAARCLQRPNGLPTTT